MNTTTLTETPAHAISPKIMSSSSPGTEEKALRINFSATQYGTFAEIGAGQEVARWFFHVGGAAGTVASTVSAYDMTVSDLRYGPTGHYVSRQRLQAMLDFEYTRLLETLDTKRGDKSTFFVFADTVATRSFTRLEDGRGWMGVRFQTEPRGPTSDIIIHVHMRDRETARQQEAIGIIGINLIYGAFYHNHEPEVLIESLRDNLAPERIELDMIRFSGPAFAHVDNRLMSLQLVEQNFTEAAMFTGAGDVLQPSEVLHQKPILVERGSFRPVTHLTLDMLEEAHKQFLQEPAVHGQEPVVLMEMTLHNLSSERILDHKDFLARVDLLSALGKTVLVTNFGRFFRLAEYLARYTQQPIATVVGIPTFKKFWDEAFYTDLDGGILESAGRLFKRHVKVYVHPTKDPVSGQLITVDSLAVPPPLSHLHAFLRETHRIEPIHHYNASYLHLSPRETLEKIQSGDPTWAEMVPPAIVETITNEGLFGYQEPELD